MSSRPPAMSRADVARVLGPVFTDRGLRYAADGRVLDAAWNPADTTLFGTVSGSGGRLYHATAVWVVRGGLQMFVGGDCSCPMQRDCKHVAAVALIGAQPTTGDVDGGGEAAPRPAWDRALDAWTLGNDDTGTDVVPLGILVQLRDHGRVGARLVEPGARGWVNGNLEWRTISTWSGRGWGSSHTFEPEHVRVAKAIHALSAVTSQFGAYSSAARDLDLTDFPHAQLWSLLSAAVDAGMSLVTGQAGRERVGLLPAGVAEMRVDVTGRPDGSHVVAPTVWVGDARRTPLAVLGDPAHGVVLAPDPRDAAAEDPLDPQVGLVLAGLVRAAPASLCRAALTGGEVVVPPEDEDRFAADGYLRLRRLAPVTSSDGSFEPPAVGPPRMLLRIVPERPDLLRTEWFVRYAIGDTTRDSPMDSGTSRQPWRDQAAEQVLRDRVTTLVGQPLRDGSARGEDAIDLATRIVPLLQDTPDALVEVEGDLPDYRDVDDDVEVHVATRLAPEERDWFDLDVALSVDGRTVPLGTVFTALADGRTRLVLPDGAHLSLRTPELERLRDLIEEASALQERDTGQLRVSRYQVDLWEQLATLGVVTAQAEEWRRQVEALQQVTEVAAVDVPEGFAGTMRPYQHEGLAWLALLWDHRLGGILADDMGLGKTLQALAMMLRARQADPDGPPFLVLAPASVVHGWQQEAARFAPDLCVRTVDATLAKLGTTATAVAAGADVVITSYTRFRLDAEAYAEVGWAGLLLDEAQAVKNPRSKLYGCIRRLPVPFALAITGTPLENDLMELWSLLSITSPGLFPNPSVFKEMYVTPIQRNHDRERLARLRRRIRPLVLRRTKEEVAADLPPKQEQVLSVELTPAHRKVYDGWLQRERRKVLGLMADLDEHRFTVLRSLTLLRRASLHAGLVEDRHERVASAKIDVLVSHLHEVVAGGHRALVFSQFTSFLSLVRDRLDREGIDHVYLDGATRNREAVVGAFKDGSAPVFVISLKAGGVGLNLTEADYCFLLDPWWNPATEAQAIDRTHRIGQTRRVMVYRLIAAGTIEEKVLDLSQRKAALFDGVMDDGRPFAGRLDADDIRALME